MSNQFKALMESYNKQALQTFTGKTVNKFQLPGGGYTGGDDFLTKDVANTNEAQLLYSAGGFFVDCCLDAAVINTTIQPIYSLANMLPSFPTTNRKTSFGFLTVINGTTGAYPNAPCDDDPEVGDIDFCKAELEVGRISYQTKTIELDALIEKACMGVREDFYLIGNVRGVSAIPSTEQLADRDFVKRMAVRRQLSLVGRALQRDMIHQLWTGDPTNGAQNTAGGGRKEFYGLLKLIANDYGTAAKPWVTGTNCAALNSDVKTFTGCIGDGTYPGIYALLQEMEDTIYNRAAYMGLLPFEAILVMHPITWSQLVKYLPCEMMGDSCVRPGVPATGNGTIINVDGGMSQTFLRNKMQTEMQLELNGRTYNVVLDSGIPLVQGGTPTAPTYTGSIFFIPLQVAGEPVLYWQYKDYRNLDQQLSAIPGSMTDYRGWSDGGHFHSVIEYLRRCFVVSTKLEANLIFKAPMLAGRIDDVKVCPAQEKPLPVLP